MKSVARLAVIAASIGMTAQPCLAAAAGGQAAPASSSIAAAPAAEARFKLGGIETAQFASASLSLAATQQAAQEVETQPKNRKFPTTTVLVIGGVVLAVLVLAAVASGTPTAGPPEGAFD